MSSLGRGGLRGGRQFVAGDAGFEIPFARMLFQMALVRSSQKRQVLLLHGAAQVGRRSRFKMRGSRGGQHGALKQGA